jgi:hypothetical protein
MAEAGRRRELGHAPFDPPRRSPRAARVGAEIGTQLAQSSAPFTGTVNREGKGLFPRPGWGVGLLAVAVAVALLAGCGFGSTKTISKSGPIGQTFDGPGGLQVQLVKYNARVPPGGDVPGLAKPKPGTHFVSFFVRLCINTTGLPVISQRNFNVPLSDGGEAELKFPETVYSDDLNLLGEPGCESGHTVFQVPKGRRASDLRFALDVAKGDAQGYTNTTKVRFDWKLPQ